MFLYNLISPWESWRRKNNIKKFTIGKSKMSPSLYNQGFAQGLHITGLFGIAFRSLSKFPDDVAMTSPSASEETKHKRLRPNWAQQCPSLKTHLTTKRCRLLSKTCDCKKAKPVDGLELWTRRRVMWRASLRIRKFSISRWRHRLPWQPQLPVLNSDKHFWRHAHSSAWSSAVIQTDAVAIEWRHFC